MAYDHRLICELIEKLSETEERINEITRERDFYMKLIAVNAGVYRAGEIPDMLNDSHRQTILALVREVTKGIDKPASKVLALPVSGGTKNGHS